MKDDLRDDACPPSSAGPERPTLSRSHARRVWRALIEFQMISEGDRVLVGFSGGKDSAFLLYALAAIRAYSPVGFTVAAGHVAMGFGQGADEDGSDRLAKFAERLGVPFLMKETNIARVAFGPGRRENPCAICSHLRRGALNGLAREHGFNKVALAHHRDDAVETFLMSVLYSGQVHTFRPVTFLDRTGITVIRPLVYFKESEVTGAVRRLGYEPPPDLCPMHGVSYRAKVKALIRALTRENPIVYDNLFKAIHEDAVGDLWPPVATDEQMRERHKAFFGKLVRTKAGDPERPEVP
ncbi:MAG: tRNA 2-thiocytidine biosynthesis TtcA family protein [Betaproteobacteria bacterium]